MILDEDIEVNRRKLHIPDRRKHAYEELEKELNTQLDQHTEDVENRLRRFFAKSLAAFAIIGVTAAVSLFGFAIVLKEFSNTRRDFILDSCKAQNGRHDATIKKLRLAAEASAKRNPKFAKEIRASVEDNVQIIDALAPKQDCVKLSRVAVGKAKPPPPVITTPEPSKIERGVNP